MKEVEVITLENNKDYIVIDKIKDNDNEYIYLSNENDETDFCIRKHIGDNLCGLENNEEFFKALELLKTKNKDIVDKLNI